jgi:N6-adenosine-specific RNA methylase IME4
MERMARRRRLPPVPGSRARLIDENNPREIGIGYWFRNKHELSLVGVKGEIPAPAPGEQFDSLIEAPVGRHSQKPTAFAEMIGTLYPYLPRLEMFTWQHRAGWEVRGNEADREAAE